MTCCLNLKKAAVCGFFTATVLISPFSGAWAHGGSHGDVEGGKPTVENPETLPEGVGLAIVKTNAEQFALATDGNRRIEILDDQGQAYIRIDKGKVYANLYAKAWHRAQMPGGGAVPDALAKITEPEKWVEVAEQTGYGWYDKRLLDQALTHFQLTMRIDGEKQTVDVVRKKVQGPDGYWRASIVSEPQWPWLTTILTGTSGQAVLLSLGEQAPQGIELLDESRQPFLRLNAQGAFVRAGHEWAERLNLPGLESASGSATGDWLQVSRSTRLHYTDPRLIVEGDAKPNSESLTRTIAVRNVTSQTTQTLKVNLTYKTF